MLSQTSLAVTSDAMLEVVPVPDSSSPGKHDFQLKSGDNSVGNLAINAHRDGVTSALAKFKFHSNVEMHLIHKLEREKPDPDVLLGFPLSGSTCIQPDKEHQPLPVKIGQFAIWNNRRGHPVITSYSANDAVRYLAFRIPSSLFTDYFGDELGSITRSECDNLIAPTTSALQMAVHQYMYAPYHGLVLQLFLESKILELVALSMDILKGNKPNEWNSYSGIKSLGTDEIDKIYAARDHLVSDMENPPSLLQLARYAGMNQQKLKCGFRRVFDDTAFGYLQQYRLEEARKLLQEGNLSVSEVALQVGYSHFGHFASIFKRKFGIAPSSIKKGVSFNRSTNSLN